MFQEKSALHLFWAALFGIIGLFWVVQALRVVPGISRLPRLTDVTPALEPSCPSIAVLFAARDEAEKLPQALATLLAQDYPDYEVVAANDRSRDATPKILEEFARANHHLKVVHLSELPPGWLGKPHALWQAYGHARGDWLVFTDADVRFAPDLLRRAVALTQARGWDHLSLVVELDLEGFWEKVAVNYFGLGFVFGAEPWQAPNPKSRSYVGVGAFQLLRRSTYEAIGTHRRLAMGSCGRHEAGQVGQARRLSLRRGIQWAAGAGALAQRLAQPDPRRDQESVRGLRIPLELGFGRHHRRIPHQHSSVSRGSFRLWLGAGAGRCRRPARHRPACLPNLAHSGLTALCADAAAGRADFLLHDAALDGDNSLARRRRLARHFLPP
ncbi:MAG: hypothetical protein DMG28_00370 [Acidobacteria bacterium]|nr:MAG: hypothetical protein DMG28_00370 [Acidobacteriota bacterium]